MSTNEEHFKNFKMSGNVLQKCKNKYRTISELSVRTNILLLFFVCVEVLRPSQPNGVMLSVVSLPNHMFTGQA